jgi:hypothetical protein
VFDPIPCGIYEAQSDGSVGFPSYAAAFTSQNHSTNDKIM